MRQRGYVTDIAVLCHTCMPFHCHLRLVLLDFEVLPSWQLAAASCAHTLVKQAAHWHHRRLVTSNYKPSDASKQAGRRHSGYLSVTLSARINFPCIHCAAGCTLQAAAETARAARQAGGSAAAAYEDEDEDEESSSEDDDDEELLENDDTDKVGNSKGECKHQSSIGLEASKAAAYGSLWQHVTACSSKQSAACGCYTPASGVVHKLQHDISSSQHASQFSASQPGSGAGRQTMKRSCWRVMTLTRWKIARQQANTAACGSEQASKAAACGS